MENGAKKSIVPDLKVDDFDKEEDDELRELDPTTGRPRPSSQRNATQPSIAMLSKQLKRLTTVFNQLVELIRAESAEGAAHRMLKDTEEELSKLKDELKLVVPDTELQEKYKESWIAKHVLRKEAFIAETRQALYEAQGNRNDQRDIDDQIDAVSLSSSMRRAAIQAEEEEAKLLLAQKQLQQRQERRRRQQEQERKLKEQEDEEREELELQLEGLRARKQAMARLGSIAASVTSNASAKSRLSMRRCQPIENWVRQTQNAGPPPDPPMGHNDYSTSLTPPRHQQALMQHILLAQAKLPVFRGEALEYLWFKQAFEAQVEAVTEDPRRRLHFLLQQLEGEPKTLIRACQLVPDPQEGFARAKALLDERYGNAVRQTLSLTTKLMEWPTVKTNQDLTAFCVQLQQCHELRQSRQGFQDLDSAANILRLASKLPSKMQRAWQTRAVDIEMSTDRCTTFTDFVGFVKRTEMARNHPVYGKLDPEKSSNRKDTLRMDVFHTKGTHQSQPSVEPPEEKVEVSAPIDSNAVEANAMLDAFKPPCLFCDKNHATSKCRAARLFTREEKRERLRGLCFSCLKPGHSARTCRNRLKCEECQGLHPTVLHEARASDVSKKEATTVEVRDAPKEESNSLSTLCRSSHAMGTTVVWAWAMAGRETQARALLDSGSSSTFITRNLAEKLGIHVAPITLQLATLVGNSQVPAGIATNLNIADREWTQPLCIDIAYVVDSLPAGGATVTESQLNAWPHLRDLPINCSQSHLPVDILVGQNVPMALFPTDSVRAGDDDPYAVKTALGWTVRGPMRNTTSPVSALCTSTSELVFHLKRLFYQDFSGVYDFASKGLSMEDRRWLTSVGASTARDVSGHYTIALPFKPNSLDCLKNNYSQAVQRMESLRRKFAAHARFRDDYTAFFQKMIDAEHVERVHDASGTPMSLNYITHHGMYHPRKPDKIRVVFNCASKFRGVSLNDCLVAGPDLTNSIVGVLIRFRQHPVVIMADVEAMFYQVLVPEEQRDYLRLLWWPQGDTSRPLQTYRMRVHLFGATSSPSVANFALRRAAQEAYDLELVEEDVRDTVFNNFYVDDCLKSVPTEEEATRIAQGLVTACQHGGFRLTKFVSNSVNVLRHLDKSLLAKPLGQVDLNEDKNDPLGDLQERALGVTWCVARDCFCFKVAVSGQLDSQPTRRTVLSRLSQVYDPLGFAAPVIITARTFFRSLTKLEDATWDTILNEDQRATWDQWISSLEDLSTVTIERCLTQRGREGEWELHTFCDASTEAYAAVTYIRQAHSKGTKVAFVMGKARVSPPKVVTIPRLELTAAKLGAELSNIVQNQLELQIKQRTFWSDSEAVLKYLKNTVTRFPVFVANRVNSILSITTPEEWRYVPTKLNPADEGSRGIEARHLNMCSWLRGPEFLQLDSAHWPEQKTTQDIHHPEVVMTTAVDESVPWPEALASCCSNALRFRRIIAVWLRLKALLRKRNNRNDKAYTGFFGPEELQEAEEEALKWIQRERWPQDIGKLEQNQTVVRASPLFKLSPAIKHGLVGLQTRTRCWIPIVPPGNVALLLVKEAHEKVAHLGRQATAAAACKSRWIMGINKQSRKVTRECTRCQRNFSVPKPTIMADLPPFRIGQEEDRPFVTTGVDYFGPFTAKRAGTKFKVYGVIFTCATSRAVHLELAESLSSDSFLYALFRFIARRGHVKRMISDNGTNFEGAQARLNQALLDELELQQEDEIKANLREKGVEWMFNSPGAPHRGGFFERLIGIVKRCLQGLTHTRSTLTSEALNTLLCECESIMNSRPLTPHSEDPNDLEPLTPNHLLIGHSHSQMLVGSYDDVSKAIRQQWKRVRQYVRQFWKRWRDEYIHLLRLKTKWFVERSRPLQEGDIVLIAELTSPRHAWQLGRIQHAIMGKDGQARSFEVKTATGTIVRPLTKLCLLETASRQCPRPNEGEC